MLKVQNCFSESDMSLDCCVHSLITKLSMSQLCAMTLTTFSRLSATNAQAEILGIGQVDVSIHIFCPQTHRQHPDPACF